MTVSRKTQIEDDADASHSMRTHFERLARTWKTERRAISSTLFMAMHPAYQQIIGLGTPAVPLILAELSRGVEHWFWALQAITRENPVPPESRGDLDAMATAWLTWGRFKGHIC
jgi:hypothetical protein